MRVGGRTVTPASNYVVFSSDTSKTLISPRPKVVARFVKGQEHEEWCNDRFGMKAKRFILGEAELANGKRRWLRIRNDQRPHRQIRFEMGQEEGEAWRAELLDLVARGL